MIRLLVAGVLACCVGVALAQPVLQPEVGVSIIRTARAEVVEALVVPGGSVTRVRPTNFAAFLVKHGQRHFLFDTGLGRSIEAQYRQDMPVWWRPFFQYGTVVDAAADQLQRAGTPAVERVVLSHSHWDHASGVPDFPAAKVAVAQPEMALVHNPRSGPGGTWSSQLGDARIAWEALEFSATPYMGFARSMDVFGDGRVVLVPMPGHTPGSVGLFVTVDSGQQYFFIGDVAWTLDALEQEAAKFWLAGALVDADANQTLQTVVQVQALRRKHPALVVVPAHDGKVHDGLGYFPQWLP